MALSQNKATSPTTQLASTRETVQQWKAKVLLAIKQNPVKANKLIFVYENFPPEEISLYEELQIEIASILPNEYDRPTIQLHIRGNRRLQDNNPDMGLLGGMGCLSDAHIIKKLIALRETKTDDFYAVLNSAPPPRPEELKKSTAQFISHSVAYRSQFIDFAANPCAHFAVLSNTAHSNLKTMQRYMDKSSPRLMDLIELITVKISIDRPSKVLVLGTTRAAQSNLYPNYLKKRNIACKLPEKEVQDKLQFYIDMIKAGKLEVNMECLNFLFKEIKHSGCSHVILACTEIPLLLSKKYCSRSNLTYMQALERKLKNADIEVKFINSEDIIINAIHHKQITVEKNKLDKKNNLKALRQNECKDFLLINLQKKINRGIEEYIRNSLGFFSILFHNSFAEAYKLRRLINSSRDLSELESQLQHFFSSYHGNIRDQSLKTRVLENILGILTKEERTQWGSHIEKGEFDLLYATTYLEPRNSPRSAR